jgi:Protein of unknown function (DUF2924)
MRIYIIGNEGITLCRGAPATVNDGEIAVASKEELLAAPLSGKRLLALWNALPGAEKWRKLGDREAWRRLHRTDPPLGRSRDLLIRVLAHQLRERAHCGASRALRRRLQNLTPGSRKAGVPLDPGIVLKTRTRLVRHWRGHAHTVLVREDALGQRYRSLTVVAERITGAHWSGPRFFGLTKRASTAVGAEAGR